MFSFQFLCLIVLCATASAFVGISPAEKKPEEFADIEGCYLERLRRVIPFDIEYKPIDGNCLRFICRHDNTTQIAGCGAIQIGKGCEKAPGNISLEYPKCCDGVRCKNADGSYSENFPY